MPEAAFPLTMLSFLRGTNAGIGYADCFHLARKGARLEEACVEKGKVEWLDLDLTYPKKVKAAAEGFMEKESRLDILHSRLQKPYNLTPEGVPDTMMINHFGVYIFTQTLLPLLKRTAEGPSNDIRIVTLASDSLALVKGLDVRFRSVEDFNREFKEASDPDRCRYAVTKLADALYARALQRQLDAASAPILVLSADPGWVWTPGVSAIPFLQKPAWSPVVALLRLVAFVDPAEGAHSSVFAAASPAVRKEASRWKGRTVFPDKAAGGRLGKSYAPQADDDALATSCARARRRS
ncbi:NAD(P)-binding protein [Epithele typhae]|uniref:NAD(P)-binding protein n=1 Tax=Epithele typhae TaxID=378194 RepID=UPI002007461B|nr:NAD(P)-binding protein [Epithele typhae]KAH9910679.1 NAD(P)-binding protein [Epithele typhae]